MEDRNTIENCNAGNRQCQANRELELERRLMKESTRLDDADTYNMNYETAIKVYARQDEFYKKWKLLKGIREARERLNEMDKEDNQQQVYKAHIKK